MSTVLDRVERRLDQLPATIFLERLPHRLGDERAAAAPAHAAIEIPNEVLFKRYVYTHGHKLAH